MMIKKRNGGANDELWGAVAELYKINVSETIDRS
jgi:hypothetical protein